MTESRPRYKDKLELDTSIDDDEWLKLTKRNNILIDEKNHTMQMNKKERTVAYSVDL